MPVFEKAIVSTETFDLGPLIKFLSPIQFGNRVSLPLSENETSRKVMRNLNRAAAKCGKRLVRIPCDEKTVVFRVVPVEKRTLNMSAEQRAARVLKTKATRAARLLSANS